VHHGIVDEQAAPDAVAPGKAQVGAGAEGRIRLDLAAGEICEQQLGVSAETHRSRWDGARPDYGSAIEILDGHARKRFTMRRTAGEVTLLDTG
jgi:hypothetical protein